MEGERKQLLSVAYCSPEFEEKPPTFCVFSFHFVIYSGTIDFRLA